MSFTTIKYYLKSNLKDLVQPKFSKISIPDSFWIKCLRKWSISHNLPTKNWLFDAILKPDQSTSLPDFSFKRTFFQISFYNQFFQAILYISPAFKMIKYSRISPTNVVFTWWAFHNHHHCSQCNLQILHQVHQLVQIGKKEICQYHSNAKLFQNTKLW